jgi:uncharacterized repeat protein (TIGR01451 family)
MRLRRFTGYPSGTTGYPSGTTCTSSTTRQRPRRRLPGARIALVLLALSGALLMAPLALGANPSANLDQCANDPAPSSPSDGCNLTASQWVNGNLGASKSVYREGDSIPYRLTFGNLSTSGSHTVKIEWDTTKAGKHAIDYLTTYNQSVLNANPCLGISGCSAFTTFPIPADPQVTGAGVTPIPGNFTLYGGTITSVSSYTYSNGPGFTGDKSASLVITFTASVANPVLAWGGHIASRKDWGNANSAVAISGSPYHTRLLDLDGTGGNQDRSLSADAVIFPGFIHIVKNTTGGNATFGYTASPAPLANFNITTVAGTGSQNFDNITNFTTYTVTENAPPTNWAFDSLVCTVASPNGGTQNVSGQTATIGLKEGEQVTCTYANHFVATRTLTIVKDATEQNYSAVGDVVHYTIVVTNTGNVAQTITVTDPNATGLTCSPTANGGSLAVGASTTCTASHTVTQADIDAGHYLNTACVDATGATQQCDDADVPANPQPALTVVKSSTTTLITAVGQVVPYTYVVTNTGNVTLTGVTLTDDKVTTASITCTPAQPATLAPTASMSCTGSHTVTQAEFDAGGNLTNIAQACGNPPTGAAVCDTDTVSIPIQAPVKGHIMHTGVTCADFVSENPSDELTNANYSVKASKVNQVDPGVMFYYIKITAPSPSFTINVTQTNDKGWKPIPVQATSQVILYESNCSKSSKGVASVDTTTGTATLTVSGATTGATYIVGIKYSLSGLGGQPVSSPFPTVTYSFASNFNGVGTITSSQDSITVTPKP